MTALQDRVAKMCVRANFPLLDRRGGCAIKKKAALLAGADGVVDQPPKFNKDRCASVNVSTTPPLAMKKQSLAASPPVQEGKIAHLRTFVGITRTAAAALDFVIEMRDLLTAVNGDEGVSYVERPQQ